MPNDTLEALIVDALPRLTRVGAVVRFDLGADGAYVIDARDGRAVLGDEDDDTDCSIRISADNLAKLIQGRMDPMVGYAMGRIKVSGSLEVAMKLVKAIG